MTQAPSRIHPQSGRLLRLAAAFAAALALPCVRIRAEGPPAEAAQQAGLTVTSISQFWSLSAEQKARPCAFRLECDVTYYDALWKILFVQDMNGDGAYVPSASLHYPFKTGQHIIASGLFVPPNADITFDHAVINAAGSSAAIPQPLAGRLAQAPLWAGRLVEANGFVDRVDRMDVGHLRLTLSIEGRSVVAWVLVNPDTVLPDFNDAFVRVQGVFNPKVGPDGNASSLEIMVPGVERAWVTGRLGDDPRFRIPAVPIESLPKQPADRLVRVSGQVKGQEPGHWVRIRDEGGQVDVMTGQARPFAADEKIEAIGLPLIRGTQWQLTDGLARPAEGSSAPAAPTRDPTLRLAAQVFELPAEEAARGRAVRLTGVVTWSNRRAPFFFIEDSSGGICVMRENAGPAVSVLGRSVEVRGVTGMGEFAPVVKASQVDQMSDLVLPVAEPVSLEHALTGAEEAKWVEMRGYLHGIRKQDGWQYLDLVTNAGDFVAVLSPRADVSSLVGAIIVVKGVCTAETGGERRLTGIKLWVPAAEFVQVEEAPKKDPFDVPARTIASLGQFNSAQSFNRLLRVSGVVLKHSPGRFIQIEEAGQGLLVFSEGREPLVAGDKIEAVGLLARQGGRVTLREAIYRRVGHGEPPRPVPMEAHYAPNISFDGRLVELEGTLFDSSAAEGVLRLTVHGKETVFDAFLDAAGADAPPALRDGSYLSLTGVYTVRFDQYGRPSAFQINLRTAGDIAVLKAPSWFTPGRVLALVAALAVAILLFIAWVSALHRQVRAQTEQIREQVKRESRLQADLHRASRLESLGLLAGGIAHDFNNLLTVVMGNLSLARLVGKLEPDVESSLLDAEKAAIRARDLTQQLLTFAKGGAPVQAAVLLPDIVREVAEFALRGSNVRCSFDIAEDLWPANVDKGQIGQVVQNVAINAMQAMPGGGVLDVSMRNEIVADEPGPVLAPGRYLHLKFTDHGHGIRPEDLEKIFDPYFTTKKNGSGLGLATVHSIVKKHAGHITAESVPANGTTFHIWLPAAQDAPGARITLSEPETKPAPAAAKARILFMDDEVPIRTLGGAILRKMGYEVTSVADGAAAVREYAKAMGERRPFGAVILDLTIPGGMGGRQTLEELLKLDPGVVAVVCSGYSNDTVLSNYRAHGFRGMVSRPYEAADLALAIERALRGGRA